jgi:predicted lipid carrier protein YhbT
MTGNAKSFADSRRLPPPLRGIARRLPRQAASKAFVAGLNLSLRRKFPDDVMARLDGHAFVIEIEDAGLELTFGVKQGRFITIRSGQEPVLRFRASAWDYASLAARMADPDTLFFNRRLVVEGDTELALLVKNTLDTIDIPRTRSLLRGVMRRLTPRTV